MPAPAKFLSAWGIGKRNLYKLFSLKITFIKIGHNVIKRYQEYEFPIEIQFSDKNAAIQQKQNIQHLFQEFVSKHQIVDSQYGNPYNCWIDNISVDDEGVLRAHGYGHRIPK